MILLLFLSSLIISCGGPDPKTVAVEVEPGLEELWIGLAADGGAPGFLGKKAAAGQGREDVAVSSADPIEVRLYRRFSGAAVKAAESDAAPGREGAAFEVREKVLVVEPFAPAVYFLDSRMDMDSEELLRGDCAGKPGFALKPLAEIDLPEKALRVDGLFPGEPGYPVMRETVLRLKTPIFGTRGAAGGRENRRIRKAVDDLVNWMEGLPGPPVPEKIVRIGAVGDIMPGRGVDAVLLGSVKGVEKIFGTVLPVMREQDLLLGNIEGVLTRRTVKTPKAYNFRFPPEILGPLKEAGFGYLSPANNHIYDYGEEGLLDTLDAMAAAGMPASGIGRDWEAAARPWEGRVGPLSVRIMSLGAYPREWSGFDGRTAAAGKDKPGILWADEAALGAMKTYFSPESFDIVMVHGGEEWRNTPSREQIALYRSFVDAGADAVFGSHPHVLQAAELYGGGFIAYSLGNFVFPGMDETEYGEESLILNLGIYKGRVRYVEFHPVRIDGRFLALDTTEKIIRRFTALTRRFMERP
jgi:poly-gamma-glutamate synthesis protein (capsule biosynthesis protein)